MSGLSDRLTITAKTLIKKYGTTGTITRTSAGTFNPETQTETGTEDTSDSVSIVIEDFRAHEIGGPIQYGDKKLLIPKSELLNLSEPEPDDIIDINGVKYRTINVVGMSAGDTNVGYSVQVRR